MRGIEKQENKKVRTPIKYQLSVKKPNDFYLSKCTFIVNSQNSNVIFCEVIKNKKFKLYKSVKNGMDSQGMWIKKDELKGFEFSLIKSYCQIKITN